MRRVHELMQRADTINRLDKEERRDAIKNIFKKIQNNDNSIMGPYKKFGGTGSGAGGSGFGGGGGGKMNYNSENEVD